MNSEPLNTFYNLTNKISVNFKGQSTLSIIKYHHKLITGVFTITRLKTEYRTLEFLKPQELRLANVIVNF
jgi:hypothetical protein